MISAGVAFILTILIWLFWFSGIVATLIVVISAMMPGQIKPSAIASPFIFFAAALATKLLMVL